VKNDFVLRDKKNNNFYVHEGFGKLLGFLIGVVKRF
jgi:hypothetical protein